MKFGVNLLPTDFGVVEEVKLAEDCGFDFATLIDSGLLWMDVYQLLCMCAAQTSRIKLGPGVTNPYTRHVAVTASAIATLDELSGGRAVLGIGRGDSAVRTLGLQPVSGRLFRRYVDACRRLTAGGTVAHDGTPISLRWARRPVPIDLAASGPKTLALCGEISEIGDAVTMCVGASPPVLRWGKERVCVGLRATGRSTDEIQLGAYIACFISDDIKRARDEVRGAAASIMNLYTLDKYLNTADLPQELIEEISQVGKGYSYTEHLQGATSHARSLSDGLIDKIAVVGPAELCVERFKQVAGCGIEHVGLVLTPIQRREDRVHIIRTIADKILPYFK